MTNSIKGVHVVFDRDIREDDAEYIINAIRMIKGVQGVESNVLNADDWMNRERISLEYRNKIFDVLKDLK